jgi:hypothetical protein
MMFATRPRALPSFVSHALLVALPLVAGCPGGGGGGTPIDAAVDDAPTAIDAAPDAPPAGGQVRVWRRQHVTVTRAQLTAMATALNLSGPIEETDDQLRMVGTAVGPTGPFTIRLGGGGALSFESAVDLVATPGQVRGTINAAGAMVVTQLSLPPALTTLPSGGVISTQITLAGNGSGTVDPAAARLALSLPLTATATCAGAGCWQGTCTIALGTLALATDSPTVFGGVPYSFATGQARAVGELALPNPTVTSCTVAAPATVAAQLGLPSFDRTWFVDTTMSPAFGPRQTTLAVDKHHGELAYVTPLADAPPVATNLPDDAAARAAVLDLLTRLGRPLPDPELRVSRRRNEADEVVAVEVVVVPRLAIDAAGTLTPVEDAGATVLLGDGGLVLSAQVHWAPVAAGPSVPAIDAAQAWAALGGTPPAPASLALRYIGFEHGMDQPFLDPVWTVLQPDGSVTKVVPATDFTPRVGLMTNLANRSLELTGPLPLAVMVMRGTPPYTVTWTSSVNGGLGTGLAIDARLSVGSHLITIAVADANGAGLSTQVPVTVTRSPFPAPAQGPAAEVDVRGALNGFPERIGASYLISTRSERVGPKVSIRNARGEIAGVISPGPFRYKITVNVGGQSYVIQSSKCEDWSNEGRTACTYPAGEGYTVATDPQPLTWAGDTGTARAKVSYDRLPGKITFTYRYRAVNAYAGPPPAFYERGGAWVFTGGESLIPQLGGVAPGLTPEVDWAYELPPAEDLQGCGMLQDMWRLSRSLPPGDPEDVGSTTLTEAVFAPCNAPPFSLPYTVTAIEVEMLTLVEPRTATGHYTALVNDGAGATSRLDATDGALDRTHQPAELIFGDGFTEITPIFLERTANVARVSGVGDWDNLHVKVAPSPYYVAFPGCNSAFVSRRAVDYRACLHVHERWFDQPTWSKGQDVNWFLLRDTGNERNPTIHPRRLVDANRIDGTPVVLWHSSKATSAQCENNGSVQNLGRPCRVFLSPVFETH